MKYLQMSLYDAWNTTYKIRPIIRPNHGFASALQSFEKAVFGVTKPSLSIYWISDSYLNYIEYIDIMYRLAAFSVNRYFISSDCS
jgi:hypothetical protein